MDRLRELLARIEAEPGNQALFRVYADAVAERDENDDQAFFALGVAEALSCSWPAHASPSVACHAVACRLAEMVVIFGVRGGRLAAKALEVGDLAEWSWSASAQAGRISHVTSGRVWIEAAGVTRRLDLRTFAWLNWNSTVRQRPARRAAA